MTHGFSLGLAVFATGSLLYVALGVWVLTLTPRHRRTLLFGAFAILYGVTYALWTLPALFHIETSGVVWPSLAHLPLDLAEVTEVASSLALLGLAASVPDRLQDRRPLLVALAAAFAFSTLVFIAALLQAPFPDARPYFASGMELVDATAFWAAAILLALRAAPAREASVEETRQLAILAVGFAFFWVFTSGLNIPRAATEIMLGDPFLLLRVGVLGAWLTVAALWGRNMVKAPSKTVRIHRGVMFTVLGLLLVGSFSWLVVPENRDLLGGIMQMVGVSLLAYGVLRHDLVGLDAKVEWGVSKTTVAGAFVAVFFVAGELAETFFGDILGPYVGVIAAGVLVFFLAPIQRLADRFAARTVPGGAVAGADAEQRYRETLEAVFADGHVSREEEQLLARRADELGIGAQRALELRTDLEQEIGRDEA